MKKRLIRFEKCSDKHYRVYGYQLKPIDLFLDWRESAVSMSQILDRVNFDLSRLDYDGIDVTKEVACLDHSGTSERRKTDLLIERIWNVAAFCAFVRTSPRRYSISELEERGISVNSENVIIEK